eukprot:790414-Prorocentrum_lima.AAC.1
MVVPPPPGRDPMTGSAAIAASTIGLRVRSVAIVPPASLRRRSADVQSRAPPRATTTPSDL